MQTVFSYIRTQQREYENKQISLFSGEDYSQYDTLNQIDHYCIDTYVDAAYDDVIGDFPFDNISKFRVLLEARATDFDTKHIEIEPERPDRESRVSAMVASKILSLYMDHIKFGTFLNTLCEVRPKYGGVLAKHVNGSAEVAPWQNLITDQSDIMAGPRIERYYLNPSQVKDMEGVWENVDEAIKSAQSIREKDVGSDASVDSYTQGKLVEIYELQGTVELCMFKDAESRMKGEEYEYDEDDQYVYTRAKILIVGPEWVDGETKEEKGIVLFAESTPKDKPEDHKYLARNPITGRGLGEGVVETLFEPQKWHNFSKTEEMRMIAIAGKKLYVTDDPDVLANIYDEGVDHGTVLRVSEGKSITELSQIPTGFPVYQSIRAELDESASRVTSSFNAKIGEEAKSGTPFRAQFLQNVEASSQFEQYREEIGFFIKDIIKDWILPDALEWATRKENIYTIFSKAELKFIDEVIVENAVTDEIIERSLNNEVLSPEDTSLLAEQFQNELNRSGNKRMLTNIKSFIKKVDGNVVIHTTDEARNKAVFFESLSNALQLLSPEDPRRNAIIERIMDAIGISKEELSLYAQEEVPTNSRPQLETQQLQQENQTGAVLPIS